MIPRIAALSRRSYAAKVNRMRRECAGISTVETAGMMVIEISGNAAVTSACQSVGSANQIAATTAVAARTDACPESQCAAKAAACLCPVKGPRRPARHRDCRCRDLRADPRAEEDQVR